MEIIGYFAALAIGLSLGLIGGGGSILTLPVLVYLLGLNPVISTAYSLFIVGLTSLIGSYKFYVSGLVSLRTATVFGLPSILAVFVTRRYLVPAIPDVVVEVGDLMVTRADMLMLVFGGLMVFASTGMIKKNKDSSIEEHAGSSAIKPQTFNAREDGVKFNYIAIVLEGLVVGALTGLVGAGGGFLLIPALVLFSKLDMKTAIGTSLLIIAAKSLLGFIGDLYNYTIDWMFLITFSAISIAGIIGGSYLSTKMHAGKLKTGFGWFVLFMGVYIMVREIFF